MDINLLAKGEGESIYYDTKFRSTLEDHLIYFRNHPKTLLNTFDANDCAKWTGDLIGFLTFLRIDAKYHWFIMRLNSMTSPAEMNDNVTSLMIPDFSEIEKIRSIFVIKTKTIM